MNIRMYWYFGCCIMKGLKMWLWCKYNFEDMGTIAEKFLFTKTFHFQIGGGQKLFQILFNRIFMPDKKSYFHKTHDFHGNNLNEKTNHLTAKKCACIRWIQFWQGIDLKAFRQIQTRRNSNEYSAFLTSSITNHIFAIVHQYSLSKIITNHVLPKFESLKNNFINRPPHHPL